ncbi:MAG: glycosyltransferase family 2 protein [Deltaproteobacteria bacterium]|jgi:glycosyltransferase involved in cell wall biosynthesis|nr:glycosyltransferase family 2 protein [Deltaproteobacteria bacterium]
MPGLSLVTYSRNDHAFADELLGYAPQFGVPLLEAILVDDASSPPYTAPQETHQALNMRVIRLERNAGAAQAKIRGLNAARGEIIFSLDADIRPHVRWLKGALPLLGHPGTGLVGAACSPARKAGYLAEALFRTGRVPRTVEECPFTPGGCMLLTRQSWEAVGGLRDFPPEARAFEDAHLSSRMRALGLRILQDNRLPVYETRNLHRLAWCRRTVGYEYPLVENMAGKYGPDKYLKDIGMALGKALEYFRESQNPILVYVFWLKLAFILHRLLETKKSMDAAPPYVSRELQAVNYPALMALFLEDLIALGADLSSMSAPLPELHAMLKRSADSGALAALENTWVARYREEDLSRRFDRHYTDETAPNLT